MKIKFEKYQGTGNDFILIDDRKNAIHLSEKMIAHLCDRKFGIGADGLILLNNMTGVDFRMIYYNADGRESSMCGNGGRCITAFANKHSVIKNEAEFMAIDGKHRAVIQQHLPIVVKLNLNDVNGIEKMNDLVYMNTGSPHVVCFIDDVSSVDVIGEGRKIRNSERFKEEGVNVNFVQMTSDYILVRTYERGVEDETLSCGTGVIASAIAASLTGGMNEGKKEVAIQTRGGALKVYFERNGSTIKDIWLEGEATFVFDGEIEILKG